LLFISFQNKQLLSSSCLQFGAVHYMQCSLYADSQPIQLCLYTDFSYTCGS